MSEKILFVDDEPNLLAACRRSLRNSFNIETALGGEEGLKLISDNGPFAVIIADMRMPSMDGIDFLSRVKTLSPDSVRMMLTGNADQQTAMDAVNEGHIFRFLTKPCPKETLIKAVKAGVHQYRLVVAERQLLEETLNGSIKVMTDVLSLVNPTAFGRASRLRRYVCHIARNLSLDNVWEFEVAAMLSQIGCVSLESEILEKVYSNQDLTSQEHEVFSAHPNIGGRLIVNIPCLEDVAHMIARQQEPLSWDRTGQTFRQRDRVAIGGQILKIATDFNQMLACGVQPQLALAKLREHSEIYDSDIVAALTTLYAHPDENQRKTLTVQQLDAHMILDEDIYAQNGDLLVTKGQEITQPILEFIRFWTQRIGIKEPIRVIVPNHDA